MKKLTYLLSIILFTIIAQACPGIGPDPDPCPPDCPVDTISYSLKINWTTYFEDDTSYIHVLNNPVYYDNKVIVSGWSGKDNNYYLYIFNEGDGTRIFKSTLGSSSTGELGIVDKYLLIPTFGDLKIFNLETLNLYTILEGKYDNYISTFGNSAYVLQYFGSVPSLDSCSIVKIDPENLNQETILTITEEEYGGYCVINPLTLEISNAGDTIIYGSIESNYNLLFSYNMSADSFAFKELIFDTGNDVFYKHPQVDKENIYITAGKSARAYSKYTRNEVWRTPLEGNGGYRPCQPILVNGRLYLEEVNNHFYCLEAENGSIVGEINKELLQLEYLGKEVLSRISNKETSLKYLVKDEMLRIKDAKSEIGDIWDKFYLAGSVEAYTKNLREAKKLKEMFDTIQIMKMNYSEKEEEIVNYNHLSIDTLVKKTWLNHLRRCSFETQYDYLQS